MFFGLIHESTLVHAESLLELSVTIFSIDQKPKHPLVSAQPLADTNRLDGKSESVSLFFMVHFVSVVGKFKRSIIIDTGIVFKMPYHLYLALCLLCKFPLLKDKTIFDFVSWKKSDLWMFFVFQMHRLNRYFSIYKITPNILFNSLGESDRALDQRNNYLLS